MGKTCNRTIESRNPIAAGGFSYNPCGRKLKYRISYKSGTTGRLVNEEVCGVHFKSAEKLYKKLLRLGYDNNFKFSKLR